MTDDPRCCGTDTCMINADGACWCGQQWDGEKMCFAALTAPTTTTPEPAEGDIDPTKTARLPAHRPK